MPKYARETTVPVSKSRAEIEAVVVRYGATAFNSGWKEDAAMIGFRIDNLSVRFILPLPKRDDKKFTHKEKDRYGYEAKRTELQAEQAYEQDVRQRWRALLLTIKAKLEAVECQISTLEEEFLAHIVLPSNQTLGGWIMDNAMPQIRAGSMPSVRLIEGPKPEVIDAEFEERLGQ